MAVRRLDRVITESRRVLVLAGINLAPILLGVERVAIKITSLAVIATGTYLWLAFCFHQFFYTQPWAERLAGFFLVMLKQFALGVVGAVPGVFTVLVIFWLTRIVGASVSRFFEGIERGTLRVDWLHPDSARATRRILLVGIWIFALTVAYPYIPGSGSDAFKGISVFAGLMLSLGSSGFVNHVMSGLVISYSGALRPGDYVTVGPVEGTVRELGALSTKIATLKGEWVTLPNGVLVAGSVINHTRLALGSGVWVSTNVTIGYDAPWRQVHALLLLAAERTPRVRKSPPPLVLQRALSDFYVEYEMRFTIDRPEERVAVLSDIHASIQDAFNEAGVQIMSPNFESQPEMPVLVPKEQWHVPPAEPLRTVDGPDSSACGV